MCQECSRTLSFRLWKNEHYVHNFQKDQFIIATMPISCIESTPTPISMATNHHKIVVSPYHKSDNRLSFDITNNSLYQEEKVPEPQEDQAKKVTFDLDSNKTLRQELEYDVIKEDVWWQKDEIKAIFEAIRTIRPGESRRGLELFLSRKAMQSRSRAKRASIKAVIETQEEYQGEKNLHEAIRLAYHPYTLAPLDMALLAAMDDEEDAQ